MLNEVTVLAANLDFHASPLVQAGIPSFFVFLPQPSVGRKHREGGFVAYS